MLPGGQVVIHRDQSAPEFVDTMMDSTQERVMIFGFFRGRKNGDGARHFAESAWLKSGWFWLVLG